MKIPTYTGLPGTSYTVDVNIDADGTTKKLTKVLTYVASPLSAYVKGGDRYHDVKKQLDITLVPRDPDFNPSED